MTKEHGLPGRHSFTARSVPRRVIMGLVVNRELEMTESRTRMLNNVVDVFVISESNITAGRNG